MSNQIGVAYPAGMYARETEEIRKPKKQLNLPSWASIEQAGHRRAVNQPAFKNPLLVVDGNGKVLVDRLKDVLGWW